MKTSEFIRRVNELGYGITDRDGTIRVSTNYDESVAAMSVSRVNVMDTYYAGNDVPNELFDLCVDYARTPIKERKDVKKYYLYNPIKEKYFNYWFSKKEYYWYGSDQTYNMQTQFTEEEIEENKFRDIMELLEKEEVE